MPSAHSGFLRIVVTVLALSACARLQAQAAGGDDYPTVIRDALQEFNEGRFAEARALFLRAHALRPSARTLRGLGMTAFELRHYAEALQLLEQAKTDARNPVTDEQRSEIERVAEHARGFVGRYRLAIQPSDASLTVDGEAPAASSALVLDVGEHVVKVSAAGYQAEARSLDVKGGEDEALSFLLQANAPEPVAPAQTPFGSAPGEVHARDRPGSSSSLRPAFGWTALGVGVAGLAGAVVAWRVGESAAARWNDDARCLRGGASREQNCGADARTARTARTLTIVGLAVGVAGGVAASVLLWPADPDRAAAIRCGDGPADLGVACSVRF